MLSPGERAISREQAFLILERLDQVEGQLRHLRDGVRRLLADVDGPDFLAALLDRPAWHAQVACRDRGPTDAFSGPGDPTAAKNICSGGPVIAECSEAGQDERHGVWGGLSVADRRRASRERRVITE